MESINECSLKYGSWSWDSETLPEANGFLHQLTSFEFLISFSVTMRILSSIRSQTINLQKATDILAAYERVQDVQVEIELLKTNCEAKFHYWFDEIKAFADELNIPVGVPRTSLRQIHRANAPADSPETYYHRNVMIPFLDHISSEMQARFGPIQQTKIKMVGLIPSTAVTYSSTSIRRR